MRALVVVEEIVHGPGRDDTAAVTHFQARGEVWAFAGTGRLYSRRRGKQRDNFATFADLDLFAFADPIEDGAEVMPHLPDGGRFHVTKPCDTMGRAVNAANV